MILKFKIAFLLLTDLSIFLFSLFLTLFFHTQGFETTLYLEDHLIIFSIIFFGWFIIFYIEGLYSLKVFQIRNLVTGILRAHFLAAIFSFVCFYFLSHEHITPKTNIFIITLFSVPMTLFSRKYWLKAFSKESAQSSLIVLSQEDVFINLQIYLREKPYLGIQFIAGYENQEEFLSSEYLEKADIIVVEEKFLNEESFSNKLIPFIEKDIAIFDVAAFFEMMVGKIPTEALNESWFIKNSFLISQSKKSFLKFLIDKVVAVLLVIIFLPVFMILIPLLIIFSGYPLFYSQKRVGESGEEFLIYKLRTMGKNAEKGTAQWSKPGDSRITKIGKFLRVTRLDEIPQLYNIIKGEMSLVGPRPERLEIIDKELKDIPFYNYRHLVRPGVTGWAQVNYRYGYSRNDSIVKLQYDLYYVKNQSVWLDIRILLRTIKIVLTGEGGM